MSAHRFFHARVHAVADLTPSIRRFTFAGEELRDYADPGYDQRIKIVFPTTRAGLERMPTGEDWYDVWRNLDTAARPPFRTYTTRRVRNDEREVDVDMVVHAVDGPASAWIAHARVGDEVLIFAPARPHTGASPGLDFVPPVRTGTHLLAGDETAAPAIAAILERLPESATGTVVAEVPDPRDVLYFPRHPGFQYRVAGREHRARHSHLVPAVRDAVADLVPRGRGGDVEEIDIDRSVLWEVPRTARGGAALKSAPLYAWLAGEAGAIRQLRRHLVREHGVDRRAVAFMGYWRLGRPEA